MRISQERLMRLWRSVERPLRAAQARKRERLLPAGNRYVDDMIYQIQEEIWAGVCKVLNVENDPPPLGGSSVKPPLPEKVEVKILTD